MNETMVLFYRARFILAPHGAGLSNIIFSRPGAVVFEVLCKHRMRPGLGRLAVKLGLRYFGTVSILSGLADNRCYAEGVKLNIQELISVLRFILRELHLK